MNCKKIKLYGLIGLVLMVALGFSVASVARAAEFDIKAEIPGSQDISNPATNPNPSGVVANAYQFALMIGGLLAFVMIVYGAVKYSAAGGNSSIQSDARDRITQALIGLALLVGAAVILSTISPKFDLNGDTFTIPSITTSTNNTNALINVGGGNNNANNGPDGICPSGGTPESCNALMSPNGGYCHAGSCYNNNNQAGPFPGGG